MQSYYRILRVKGALRIFLSVLISRGATIAADFALFWLIADLTSSLPLAGAAMGLSYLAIALGNPLQGRLSDKFGVEKILIFVSFLFLLVGLAFFLANKDTSIWLLLILSLLLGLFRPSGQGFGRAAWQVLYKTEDERIMAASLDSIQSASINGLATLLAVALSQFISPGLVLLVAASFAFLSSLALALSPIAKKLLEKQKRSREKRTGSLLQNTSLRKLLLLQALFFAADGGLIIALLLFAKNIELPAVGGALIALFLAGGAFGSFRFGKEAKKHHDLVVAIQKLLPRYFLSLLLLPLAILFPPIILPLLLHSGYSRRGFTPSVQLLAQEMVPIRVINEALAWVFVALVIGSGIGRLLAGQVSEVGVAAVLLLPALLNGLTWLVSRSLKSKPRA